MKSGKYREKLISRSEYFLHQIYEYNTDLLGSNAIYKLSPEIEWNILEENNSWFFEESADTINAYCYPDDTSLIWIENSKEPIYLSGYMLSLSKPDLNLINNTAYQWNALTPSQLNEKKKTKLVQLASDYFYNTVHIDSNNSEISDLDSRKDFTPIGVYSLQFNPNIYVIAFEDWVLAITAARFYGPLPEDKNKIPLIPLDCSSFNDSYETLFQTGVFLDSTTNEVIHIDRINTCQSSRDKTNPPIPASPTSAPPPSK